MLALLRKGRAAGEIPNDFAVCAGRETMYSELGRLASLSGALAWGLCGSGSGYFTLFRPGGRQVIKLMLETLRGKYDRFKWLRPLLVLE
jgi:hypothetical protein